MITHLQESGINFSFYYPINERGLTSEKTSFRLHYSRDREEIKELEKTSEGFAWGVRYIGFGDYNRQYGKPA